MSIWLGILIVTLLLIGAAPKGRAQHEMVTVNQGSSSHCIRSLKPHSDSFLMLSDNLFQVNPSYLSDEQRLIRDNDPQVCSGKPVKVLKPKVRLLRLHERTASQQGVVIPYLASVRLHSALEMQASVRVLGGNESQRFLTQQQDIYVSGVHLAQHWEIYRPLDNYQRNEHVVTALKKVAIAQRLNSDNALTRLTVVSQSQEVQSDDIAIPLDEEPPPFVATVFHPEPAVEQIVASILGTLEGNQYVGKSQMVIIDRGTQDTLSQGTVFDLYARGGVLEGGIQLPSTVIGRLMVIHPYEYFSLAMVTESSQPVSVHTLLKSPLGRATQ